MLLSESTFGAVLFQSQWANKGWKAHTHTNLCLAYLVEIAYHLKYSILNAPHLQEPTWRVLHGIWEPKRSTHFACNFVDEVCSSQVKADFKAALYIFSDNTLEVGKCLFYNRWKAWIYSHSHHILYLYIYQSYAHTHTRFCFSYFQVSTDCYMFLYSVDICIYEYAMNDCLTSRPSVVRSRDNCCGSEGN